jgi:hypothetical protein
MKIQDNIYIFNDAWDNIVDKLNYENFELQYNSSKVFNCVLNKIDLQKIGVQKEIDTAYINNFLVSVCEKILVELEKNISKEIALSEITITNLEYVHVPGGEYYIYNNTYSGMFNGFLMLNTTNSVFNFLNQKVRIETEAGKIVVWPNNILYPIEVNIKTAHSKLLLFSYQQIK